MDIHPWTKYELARMRDEERLLSARDALRARELREPELVGGVAKAGATSWLDRLLRRDPVADGATVRTRPV